MFTRERAAGLTRCDDGAGAVASSAWTATSSGPDNDPLHRAVIKAYEGASNLCAVVARHRKFDSVDPLPLVDDDSVMRQKPWTG